MLGHSIKKLKEYMLKKLVIIAIIYCLAPCSSVSALPQGGQSVSGNVQFSQPNSQTLNVTTKASSSIAQYSSFNVNSGETVNFDLPNASSTILNRINDANPSSIFGNINSNGQVFLFNSSGIIFGKTSQVNTAGIAASTLNINNQDFLNKNYVFTQNQNQTGAISNQGIINSSNYAAMISGAVDNSGSIVSKQVGLAVGSHVTLNIDNNINMNLTVDDSLQTAANNYTNAIRNTGTIKGDQISLEAKLKSNIYKNVVNNEGIIETGFTQNKAGDIEITALNDDDSAVSVNSGLIQANNGGNISFRSDTNIQNGAVTALGNTGGTIKLLGDNVFLN